MSEKNAAQNGEASLEESAHDGDGATEVIEVDSLAEESDDSVADAPSTTPRDVPTKVCSSCSVQSQTGGAFCPNCGKAFDRSRPFTKRNLRLVAIIVGVVVLLGGSTLAIAQTVAHKNEVAAQQEAAQILKAAEKAKAAKAAKEAAAEAAAASAKEAADEIVRTMRAASVIEIEASITKDAQSRVKEGTLDGPITKSSCTPLGGGSSDILTALTTTFSCIAINKENADGSSSGYRFSATMDWNAGSYSWHLGD